MKKARYFYAVVDCGKTSNVSHTITDGRFPSIKEMSGNITGGSKTKLPTLSFLHEFKSRQDFVDFCGDEKLCDDFDKLDCKVKTKYKEPKNK